MTAMGYHSDDESTVIMKQQLTELKIMSTIALQKWWQCNFTVLFNSCPNPSNADGK